MPWMRKYRRLAAMPTERGTRVTTERHRSSFSRYFPSRNLIRCDMHQLRQRPFILTALLLGACTAASEHSKQRAGTPSPAAQTASVAPALAVTREAHAAGAETVAVSNGAVAIPPVPRAIARFRDPATTPVIRGLYVNRFAAQSARRMRWLVGIADSTEINGLVIDMKDEFGLNFHSANAEFRKNEGAGHGKVRDVRALLDTLHAHNVFAIARIVVFKDPTRRR